MWGPHRRGPEPEAEAEAKPLDSLGPGNPGRAGPESPDSGVSGHFPGHFFATPVAGRPAPTSIHRDSMKQGSRAVLGRQGRPGPPQIGMGTHGQSTLQRPRYKDRRK